MGSLRSLRSNSKQRLVPDLPEVVPDTLYEIVERWAMSCQQDFTSVVGELYSGHAAASYYTFRDSLHNYYGLAVTRETFNTEILEIIQELWSKR